MLLGHYSRRIAQVMIDLAICVMAWVAAYQIRFDGQLPPAAYQQMIMLLFPAAAGQVGINALLRIYRYKWRYLSIEDGLYIARSYFLFGLVLATMRVLPTNSAGLLHIPVSIIVTTFGLAFGGAITARLLWRLIYEHASRRWADGAARRFVLVGAGAHGATVAREMVSRRGIEVVGFVDNDPGKQGAVIAGVPVLGRTADLPQIIVSRDVDEVLVCVPPESRHLLQIGDVIRGTGPPVRSRIVPTIDEILRGASAIPLSAERKRRVKNRLRRGPTNGNDGAAAGVHVSPYAATQLKQAHSSGNGNGSAADVATVEREAVPEPKYAHSAAQGDGSAAASAQFVPVAPVAPALRNKTILITGGGGFIGSTLAERLAENNHLILLDHLFTGAPIQYTSLLRHPNVTLVQGSILEVDLRTLVKQADVVVHAAAILGVGRVCNSGRETLETNYVGTSRMLKALDASPNIQRFVYFSSSEVFGVNSYRVDEASRPTIGPIAEARWCYAMSKLAGEHLVASYFRETHLPIAIVRPFNIFGPRRTGDYALRRFIVNALQGEPLEIHGDGTQIRSWCYIEDFCSALVQMIVRKEAVGEDFNIGNSGNTLTIYELAQKVIELTGSSSRVVFRPSPFPDISIRVPSLDKARRLLGYEPQYDLNTGLKLTIQWYRNNSSSPPLRAPIAAPTHAALGGAA